MSDKIWNSSDGKAFLYLGDCREVLREFPGEFTACVTDPPYSRSVRRFRDDRLRGYRRGIRLCRRRERSVFV